MLRQLKKKFTNFFNNLVPSVDQPDSPPPKGKAEMHESPVSSGSPTRVKASQESSSHRYSPTTFTSSTPTDSQQSDREHKGDASNPAILAPPVIHELEGSPHVSGAEELAITTADHDNSPLILAPSTSTASLQGDTEHKKNSSNPTILPPPIAHEVEGSPYVSGAEELAITTAAHDNSPLILAPSTLTAFLQSDTDSDTRVGEGSLLVSDPEGSAITTTALDNSPPILAHSTPIVFPQDNRELKRDINFPPPVTHAWEDSFFGFDTIKPTTTATTAQAEIAMFPTLALSSQSDLQLTSELSATTPISNTVKGGNKSQLSSQSVSTKQPASTQKVLSLFSNAETPTSTLTLTVVPSNAEPLLFDFNPTDTATEQPDPLPLQKKRKVKNKAITSPLGLTGMPLQQGSTSLSPTPLESGPATELKIMDPPQTKPKTWAQLRPVATTSAQSFEYTPLDFTATSSSSSFNTSGTQSYQPSELKKNSSPSAPSLQPSHAAITPPTFEQEVAFFNFLNMLVKSLKTDYQMLHNIKYRLYTTSRQTQLTNEKAGVNLRARWETIKKFDTHDLIQGFEVLERNPEQLSPSQKIQMALLFLVSRAQTFFTDHPNAHENNEPLQGHHYAGRMVIKIIRRIQACSTHILENFSDIIDTTLWPIKDKVIQINIEGPHNKFPTLDNNLNLSPAHNQSMLVNKALVAMDPPKDHLATSSRKGRKGFC